MGIFSYHTSASTSSIVYVYSVCIYFTHFLTSSLFHMHVCHSNFQGKSAISNHQCLAWTMCLILKKLPHTNPHNLPQHTDLLSVRLLPSSHQYIFLVSILIISSPSIAIYLCLTILQHPTFASLPYQHFILDSLSFQP